MRSISESRKRLLTRRMPTRAGLAVVSVLALALGLAACGDSDDDAGSDHDLAWVNDQLEGLEGDARTDKLTELAQDENGDEFLLYYSVDGAEDWIKEFEDGFGIKGVKTLTASQTDLLTRAAQQAEAGFRGGADAMLLEGDSLTYMQDNYDIFQKPDTPLLDTIKPELIDSDSWLPIYVVAQMAAWRTDVPAPTSWKDLLENGDGIVFEATDWNWWAALVNDWLVPEEGMTVDEAVGLFEDAAKNASGAEGHTLTTQLLASGEYNYAPSVYYTRVNEFMQDDAPIDWEPALDPVFLRNNGYGIANNTDRPATAMLFAEYLLTTVQQQMIEDESAIPVLSSLQDQVPILDHPTVPLWSDQDEGAKEWQDKYQEDILDQLGPITTDEG